MLLLLLSQHDYNRASGHLLAVHQRPEVSAGHCGSEALRAGSNWPHSNINTSLHGVELAPSETMWANQYNLTGSVSKALGCSLTCCFF